jgi:hypothetical protein
VATPAVTVTRPCAAWVNDATVRLPTSSVSLASRSTVPLVSSSVVRSSSLACGAALPAVTVTNTPATEFSPWPSVIVYSKVSDPT